MRQPKCFVGVMCQPSPSDRFTREAQPSRNQQKDPTASRLKRSLSEAWHITTQIVAVHRTFWMLGADRPGLAGRTSQIGPMRA